MADVQTCEVDAKLATVSLGPLKAKFDNHIKHSIIVWQFNHYLCNNESHS
jgi:hypothetical protein